MAQIPVDPAALTGVYKDGGVQQVLPDLAFLRILMVNVAFCGAADAGDRGWVLIDAGIGPCAKTITEAAAARFGARARPAAIVMTHGHFDHTGGLHDLPAQWDCPVYVHAAEQPFLNGSAAYMPPDPAVGGGIMSTLSPFYPRDPIDVSERLRTLPGDGTVPDMPSWHWIHTPGHAPGHVSFWREADRAMLPGDAFITTRQESAYAVATQAPELHGPPMYYTSDWDSARESVRRLAALEPETVITGHGPALQGEAMRAALRRLAEEFDQVARPRQGRYA